MMIKDLPWTTYQPGMLSVADADKFFWFKRFGFLVYVNIMPNSGSTVHVFNNRASLYARKDGFTSREEAVSYAMDIYNALSQRRGK